MKPSQLRAGRVLVGASFMILLAGLGFANRLNLGIQLFAKRYGPGNQGDTDEGGNEGVLDGRCPRFVFDEPGEDIFHSLVSSGCRQRMLTLNTVIVKIWLHVKEMVKERLLDMNVHM